MRRFDLEVFAILVLSLSLPHVASAAETVIGPGPQSLLYITDNSNYHILDGTLITSPSLSGPPSTFVVPTDAIEFRGGGHIRIDGGTYRGGNATFSGANGDLSSTVAADALHLRQSSGEVHSGIFHGGDAVSSTWLGPTIGGNGLILVESSIKLYGGVFEGGTANAPELLGGIRTTKAAGVIAYDRSKIELYGGTVIGSIDLVRGSILDVYGTELSFQGGILTGKYSNGSAFRHNVRLEGGIVRLNLIVPEPFSSQLVFLSVGLLVLSRRIARR